MSYSYLEKSADTPTCLRLEKKKFRIAGFRRVPRRSIAAGFRSGVLGILL